MVCNDILGTVDDHPDDGGQLSLDWWVTKLWMVGDPRGYGWWSPIVKYVTIFDKVDDHILDGW